MLILGIETSCDDTSIAIVRVVDDKVEVLSNVVSSQVQVHAPHGGVVPILAAREHEKNLPHVLDEALRLATLAQGDQIDLTKINLIAVTSGPGLAPSLWKGVNLAVDLAKKYEKPIIGVNHMEGHVYSNWLEPVGAESSKLKAQSFPALCLIVSGGHTQLTLMKDHAKYQTIGRTLDDAAGEAFDKIARILGLGFPGGPAISTEAEKFQALSSTLQAHLPRPMIHSKNYDFSFSGLKTAVLYLVRDLIKAGHKLEDFRAQVAHEAQEAIVDVLITKTVRAAKEYNIKSIMLSGGVSANKLLRQKLNDLCSMLHVSCFIPPMQYTTDNAAMIALAGYFSAKAKKLTVDSWKLIQAEPNWEIL